MRGHEKRTNYWPAFADMMFMLALTTLVVSAGALAYTHRQQKEIEIARKATSDLESRLVALGLDPSAPQECGLATPVVRKMEACLQEHGVPVDRRGCSLSVEGAIQFAFNETRLAPDATATASRVANCVIEGAREVARFPRLRGIGLDAISIEGHADACGYRDWRHVKTGGMEQPASRAKAVYDLVFDQVTAPESGFSTEEKAKILARIATRSFGPYRPLVDSSCTCGIEDSTTACQSDRRVEIVVQGQIGGGEANWLPLEDIVFSKVQRAATTVPPPRVIEDHP